MEKPWPRLLSKRGFCFFLSVSTASYHVPVLLDAVDRLASGRERIVDATTGGGGHLERLSSAGARILAIDRDPEALAEARRRVGPEAASFVLGRFGSREVLDEIARFRPDLVLFDLGISSHQIDTAVRGFSFRPGVPLDMRMDPAEGVGSAAELIARGSVEELTHIFREYADEPRARRLATEIARRRQREPFETSDHLVNAIRAVLGARSGPPDFARLFQAVRIAVNHELADLELALPAVRDALVDGGVLAVITYHSGEDRIVKHTMREWAKSCVCPPEYPVCTCRGRALGVLVHKKPIVPSDEEIALNPRARSAKLRSFRKVDGA